MGWLHRHKMVEALIEPESRALSMSRIASWFFTCLDIAWVMGVFLRLPHPSAYAPVSSMLAVCTGAAFAAYGANSAGRFFGGGLGWADRLRNLPLPPPPPSLPRSRVAPPGGPSGPG